MDATVWIYLGLTVITTAFALLVDNREYVQLYIAGSRPAYVSRRLAVNRIGQTAVYGLLAGVSVCRIAVGNDYWGYAENFRLIGQGRYVSSEFGFNFVVKWMQDLFGYNNYLPIFGLFSLVTVYFFMKALKDQGEWYAGSLYLLLTGGYYFSSLNSIRYYLVLAIALFSMKYVLRGEYGKFLLWILPAASFHKSVLFVVPVYLAAKWFSANRLKLWNLVFFAAAGAAMIAGQGLFRKIIFYFYPYYENSAFDIGELSLANIAKCLGVLVLSLICYKDGIKDSLVNRFYFYLNLMGLILYVCGSYIPEVSRIGYYMIIAQILLAPNLLLGMKKGRFRNICIIGTAAAFFAYFLIFLNKSYDVSVRLLPYYNWIFQ